MFTSIGVHRRTPTLRVYALSSAIEGQRILPSDKRRWRDLAATLLMASRDDFDARLLAEVSGRNAVRIMQDPQELRIAAAEAMAAIDLDEGGDDELLMQCHAAYFNLAHTQTLSGFELRAAAQRRSV